MEQILELWLFSIFCVAYSMAGGYLIKMGIEGFKNGEYFKSGCSFLLVVPQVVFLVKMTWEL